MKPEPGPHVETHVADFADILLPMDGSEPPVMVGGHAVNLWSMYFLANGVAGLERYLPFTSKDLDLVGTMDLLDRLHLRLKGKLTRSEPRSPVLGRLVIPSASGDHRLRETETISFLLAALFEHGLWRRLEGGARRWRA